MDTIEKAADYALEAADNIADTITRNAQALGEEGMALINAGRKSMTKCCHFVGYHPLASMGIAITAVYLLSRS